MLLLLSGPIFLKNSNQRCIVVISKNNNLQSTISQFSNFILGIEVSEEGFEPSVLDCLPKERKNIDVVRSLAMVTNKNSTNLFFHRKSYSFYFISFHFFFLQNKFCLPFGVQKSTTQKQPIFFGTVFTDEYRNRCNAYALLFYDQKPEANDFTHPIDSQIVVEKKEIKTTLNFSALDVIDEKFKKEKLSARKFSHLFPIRDDNLSSSDEKVPLLPKVREDGHPLGEMGTSLQAQIDYTKNRKRRASLLSTSAEIDYSALLAYSSPLESISRSESHDESYLIERETQFLQSLPPLSKKEKKVNGKRRVSFHNSFLKELRNKNSIPSSHSTVDLPSSNLNQTEASSQSTQTPPEYYSKCIVIISKFPYFRFFFFTSFAV